MKLRRSDFRVASAILDRPDAPIRSEDHGTVIVQLDGRDHFVDTATLHTQPLALSPDIPATIDHPIYPITAHPQDGLWRVDFTRPHDRDAMTLRMLRAPVTAADFVGLYEATRTNSGFNEVLYVRHVLDDGLPSSSAPTSTASTPTASPQKFPSPTAPPPSSRSATPPLGARCQRQRNHP